MRVTARWALARVFLAAGVCAAMAAMGAGNVSFAPVERPQAAAGGAREELDGAAVRVVDGDTIAIGRERIRLMGFDAPETHRPRCARERRLGQRARARLAGLLRGGEIGLQRRGRDRYGRTLAVLAADGRDVAAIMIAEGLARPYHGERRKGWCGARLQGESG
jgi:micrococcal nuclease